MQDGLFEQDLNAKPKTTADLSSPLISSNVSATGLDREGYRTDDEDWDQYPGGQSPLRPESRHASENMAFPTIGELQKMREISEKIKAVDEWIFAAGLGTSLEDEIRKSTKFTERKNKVVDEWIFAAGLGTSLEDETRKSTKFTERKNGVDFHSRPR